MKTREEIDPAKYISVDPEICHGRPCFRLRHRLTRIPIHIVLELLEAGVSVKEITSRDYYPQLTADHVRAALKYAADQFRNRQFVAFGN